MLRRLLILLCLLGACLGAPALAATGTKKAAARKPVATAKKATTPAAAPRKAIEPAAATAKKAIEPGAAGAKKAEAPAAVTAKQTDGAATARTVAAPRRLEDIHIEGEIPAPLVLFVTARDQRRFTKFHHHRYLKTSVQVGESTLLPNRVALTTRPTTPAGTP
jgi:hypothetical protein